MSIVRRTIAAAEVLKRVDPLEGTNMSLFNSIIPNWWSENGLLSGSWTPGDATLAERVWVSNRCIQLNAQQIASMPLEFHGPEGAEPAWMSNPDPNWFPNGIGDAMFAIIAQMYGWGFTCLYITDYYADGYPRMWMVLPSANVHIENVGGERVYKVGDKPVEGSRVVQIDRNPNLGLHGCSALRAYAQNAWGLLAAGNQSMTVNQGGIPPVVLKPTMKKTKAQAEALQTQWMEATARRNGAPPVLPPDVGFEVYSFNPADLALLETQEWNSRVLATAFGVPSVILNMALQGGLTYQNPLALMQMWWLTELRTTAKRVEDAFSSRMLPRGQWVSVDASDITTGPVSEDDPQAAQDQQPPQVSKASPAQQPRPLQAIGGGGG